VLSLLEIQRLRQLEDGATSQAGSSDPGSLYGADDFISDDGLWVPDEATGLGSPRSQQPGRCVLFDGANDYIDCGLASQLDFTGPFTMSVWVNMGTQTTYHMVASKYAANKGWDIYALSGKVYVALRGTSAITGNCSPVVMTTGTWQHLAVTATLSEVLVYINGVLQPMVNNTGTWTPDPATASSLQIGARSASLPFIGKMCDMRFYDVALTGTQIASIYRDCRLGVPQDSLLTDNLVGHWKLDEQQGYFYSSPCFDSSGNGNHGMPQNTTFSTWHHEEGAVPFSWANAVGFSEAQTSADGTDVTPATLNDFEDSAWVSGGTGIAKTDSDTLTWTFTGADQKGYAYHILPAYDPGDCFVFEGEVQADSGVKMVRCYFESGTDQGRVSAYGAYARLTCDDSDWTPFRASWDCISDTNANARVIIYAYSDDHGGGASTVALNFRNLKLIKNASRKDTPRDESDPTKDIHSNELTYTGLCPRDAKLIESNCVTLDGLNDYISFGTDDEGLRFTASQPFTLAAWVRPAVTGGTYGHIFNRRTTGSSYQAGYMLRWYDAGRFHFLLADGSDFIEALTISGEAPEGSWYHVTAVYDGSGKVSIYQDGVCHASGSGTLSGDMVSTACNFRLGILQLTGGTTYNPFEGRICDARVYNYALTNAQVADLAAGNVPAVAPIRHWPMAEGSGTIIYDASGNLNFGTATGATSAELWANTQDVFHYNITNGFRWPELLTNSDLVDDDSDDIPDDWARYNPALQTSMTVTDGVVQWAMAGQSVLGSATGILQDGTPLKLGKQYSIRARYRVLAVSAAGGYTRFGVHNGSGWTNIESDLTALEIGTWYEKVVTLTPTSDYNFFLATILYQLAATCTMEVDFVHLNDARIPATIS